MGDRGVGHRSEAGSMISRSPEAVEAGARFLEELMGVRPEVHLVLGSGLGEVADAVENAAEVPFGDVPGLPGAGVAGHAGRFVAGEMEGRAVLVQAGRFHLYEGHPEAVVSAPVRIAAALGVGTLVLTNAAGGIRRSLEPGSLMLLEDHINLMWRSPLAGPVRPGEERFPDMSAPYDPALQRVAEEAARELEIPLQRGVYAGLLGPTYETPAEIRMLERLGADAVGMSTVPEVVTARALELRCLAVSVITNRAAGLSPEPPSHDEVMEVGRRAGGSLAALLLRVVARLPEPADAASPEAR